MKKPFPNYRRIGPRRQGNARFVREPERETMVRMTGRTRGARRPTWRTVLNAVVVCFASVVATAVVAEPAHARCVDGTVIRSTLEPEGLLLMSERPFSSTCDNDGVYRFHLVNHVERIIVQGVGSFPARASAWFQDDNGNWKGIYGEYALGQVDRQWPERGQASDSNSWANMHLCVNAVVPGRGYYWICGWGRNQPVAGFGHPQDDNEFHRHVERNTGF